uniref:N-acetylglucosaminylphosphatidylinositol deacetylase n=1 Tax=Mola mola TaxID=94237 RepID=A0A3Q3WA04_MOLML
MSVCLAVLIFLAYLVFIKCIYRRHRRTFLESLKHVLNASTCREAGGADIRVLIVTAHPDDECMFFAPTIIQLVELHASVHLLCLSQGNYYNKGAQRKQELLNSCAVLGIPDSRITIVNQKNLPDDPKAQWKVSVVSSVIMKHIRAHSFNMVLTFDGRGVSGHANHIAIHKAPSYLSAAVVRVVHILIANLVFICSHRLLFSVPGDCWLPQEVHLLPGASPQLPATLMSLLLHWLTGLQASQSKC